MSITRLFNVNYGGIIYTVMSYLMIISLLEKPTIKKNFFPIVFILLVIILLTILTSKTNIPYSIMMANNLVITIIVLKNFIVEYADKSKINIFLLVLIFYMITSILKFINLLLGFADAAAFFIITSIAQIAFGFFFSIFREDNPKLHVQL